MLLESAGNRGAGAPHHRLVTVAGLRKPVRRIDEEAGKKRASLLRYVRGLKVSTDSPQAEEAEIEHNGC